jgi:Mn2+/Fe2+ NRAMP family transporter
VTHRGLADILRRRYPRPVAYAAVALLSLATTVNVGADLGAVADSLHLLTGLPALSLIPPTAAAILVLLVAGSYRVIANTLKVFTLALLTYVLDGFILRPDFADVARFAIVPTLSLDPEYVRVLVAIFGTTISPYLFFWQSDEEVEQKREDARRRGPGAERTSDADMTDATVDVTSGMSASNVIMFFIILSTALTLHAQGRTDVKSGADAAQALRPIAGDLAGVLFAVGMIGAGLLAVPVLSGATAYALGETFGWRVGLNEKWRRAKPFYAVIGVATALGVLLNVTSVRPIEALYWSSVLNGILAPPLLVLIMLAARDQRVMRGQRIGPLLTALGWATTIVMFLALTVLGASALGSR